MNPIKVLLADDHNVVRAGLRALLAAAGDMQVIGEAENGQQALREAHRLRPDVVVLDLAMPLSNGVTAARQLAAEVPSAKVLILSSYNEQQHIRQAIEAGAASYVLKQCAAQELLQAVRETAQGNAFFSPAVCQHLLTQWRGTFLEARRAKTDASQLSVRQAQVFQLIAEGYLTKQIADVLSISKKTTEKHRQSLMTRLNLHKIASLTRQAVSRGVIESNHPPDWAVTFSPAPHQAGGRSESGI